MSQETMEEYWDRIKREMWGRVRSKIKREMESYMPANVKDRETKTTVHIKVAESIAKLGPSIEDQIASDLVNREKTRRANAWVQVHDQLTKLESDLKKIRKKPLGFDDDGKSIGEAPWTKEQTDERKKLQDQINKRMNALIKALHKDNPEWDDVFNFIKSGGGSGGNTVGQDKGEGQEEAK